MSRSPFANVFQSGRVAQQSNLPVKTQSPPSRSSPAEARWATRSFGVSVWHTGQRCLARAGLQLTAAALGPLPEGRVASPRGAPPPTRAHARVAWAATSMYRLSRTVSIGPWYYYQAESVGPEVIASTSAPVSLLTLCTHPGGRRA